MNLTNNELTYEESDTPKYFSFIDWNYLVPVLKAVSTKIVEVEQRGIYQNEPKRFALVTSESLTEEEVTAVLEAWTNFSPLYVYKIKKIEEISALSVTKRRDLMSDDQLINAAIGAYDMVGATHPHFTNEQGAATINLFRVEYYRVKSLIEIATNETEVDSALASVNFPTQIVGK